MALFGLAPAVMKPTALVLNLLVAGLGTFRYARRDISLERVLAVCDVFDSLRIFRRLLSTSRSTYRGILGLVLLFAAWRWRSSRRDFRPLNKSDPSLNSAGDRGAHRFAFRPGRSWRRNFLSPVLLLAGWADVRKRRDFGRVHPG